MRAAPVVTTTDLLKLAGLAFVLVDHFGLFFAPGDDWWRVFGRAAAPIFFFLIGFARTRGVPMSWIALGVILTVLDAYVSQGLEDVTLNILFNFALIRLAAPLIERHVLPRPLGLPALALVCAAMIPLAAIVLEYGAEGWLWALVGIAVREVIARGDAPARRQRNLVTGFSLAVYLLVEIRDFELAWPQAAALCALMSALALALANFRRTDAPFQPPAPMARALSWIGRRSLEIYAVTLFAMQAAGHALGIGEDAEEDDEGGDEE